MPRMFPGVRDPTTRSSAERRLYEAMARELSDKWVVFHSVKWIGQDSQGRPRDGEADFVLAHPDLGVLTLEVKGGRISFDQRTGHFISTDAQDVSHDIGDPFEQAMKSKKVLLEKLQGTPGWQRRRVVFGHAVAFPDAVMDGSWLHPNAPREIVISALDVVSLESRLREVLQFWRGPVSADQPPGPVGIEVLERVLGQASRIRNPLLAIGARADEQSLIELTAQQFRYLRFLKGVRRAAIAGCAGSGKTLLAVEKARSLADEGLRVLFVCYNRALADYVGITLAHRQHFDVYSFHQLCVHWANRASARVAHDAEASEEYFTQSLSDELLAAAGKLGGYYDALIVDEAQDFHANWWEALPWVLNDPANGILYIFFDDNQRIYPDRLPVPIKAEPFPLDENCRNTQCIFDVVGQFYRGPQPPRVLGPQGHPAEIIPYSSGADGNTQLRRLLHRLLNEDGFRHDELAILTGLGSRSSSILGQRLGNVQITDRLPLQNGEVFGTTIRRFKGLERPVIILAEIDGRLPADDAEMLMYIGTSRARAYLIILLGEGAPEPLLNSLANVNRGGR